MNPRPQEITVNKGTTIARMEAVAVVTAISDPVIEAKLQLFENMIKQLGSHVSTSVINYRKIWLLSAHGY